MLNVTPAQEKSKASLVSQGFRELRLIDDGAGCIILMVRQDGKKNYHRQVKPSGEIV